MTQLTSMMQSTDISLILGEEIEDAAEETFLLFTHPLPSQDLGSISSTSPTLHLTLSNQTQTLTIHQSPPLLTSNLPTGTTGAVLWRTSLHFANWISHPSNILFHHSLLTPNSTVLELGCGIAGIVAIALSSHIRRYIATDQPYVLKGLRQNLAENIPAAAKKSEPRSQRARQRQRSKQAGKRTTAVESTTSSERHTPTGIEVVALDWELDAVSSLPDLLGGSATLDAVIGCDCVYNETLIDPFVQTCAELCGLGGGLAERPTLCIVAQQLRSPVIMEAWITAFHELFRVWRFPDELLSRELKSDSGYVVHVGILR